MKITAIELYHVSVPLKETFWPTWIPGYPQTHNRFTLIKIVTDEGIEGYSAGSAMGKERAGLGDLLGGYLMGADPTDIDRVQGLLKQAGFLGWRNFWIEPACWDIMGKVRANRFMSCWAERPVPLQPTFQPVKCIRRSSASKSCWPCTSAALKPPNCGSKTPS